MSVVRLDPSVQAAINALPQSHADYIKIALVPGAAESRRQTIIDNANRGGISLQDPRLALDLGIYDDILVARRTLYLGVALFAIGVLAMVFGGLTGIVLIGCGITLTGSVLSAGAGHQMHEAINRLKLRVQEHIDTLESAAPISHSLAVASNMLQSMSQSISQHLAKNP